MNTKCRFHISHLCLTSADGRVIQVPWIETYAANYLLYFKAGFRRQNRGLPVAVCVGPRAASLVDRLRDRSEWRTMDRPLHCPSVTRTVIGPAVLFVAGVAACTHPLWLLGSRWQAALRDQLAWLPSEMRHLLLSLLVLIALGIALYFFLYLFVVLPYARFRWRNSDMVGLRVTPDALRYLRRDGSEDSFAWRDIVSFDNRGKLVFRGGSDATIHILARGNVVHRLIFARLRRTRRQAESSPSTIVMVARTTLLMLAILAFATAVARLLLPFFSQ